MNVCMAFPETFDEFAETFGFVDSKEYYTNGSELIQVFRVKQWLEHESNRLQAEKEALIAGQETLQKALADKINESEKQSQNFKVLVSDHRTLQQSFDNLKGLYEEQKARVKKAKEKCVYFAKEVQKARTEKERMTELAANWKDAAYTYADSIDRVRTEAIKEFAERLKMANTSKLTWFSEDFDNLVKEMVGDTE